MPTLIGAAVGFLAGYLWIASRGEALGEVVGLISAIVGALIGLGIQLSMRMQETPPKEGGVELPIPPMPPKPGPLGRAKPSETRWQEISQHLGEFQKILSPSLPRLQIVRGNEKSWSDAEYAKQRSTGIFEKCGVYLIFDPERRLQYVGVATNRFEDRIWAHDESIARGFTDLIPFEKDWAFLALALECFLIARLAPPGNTKYRTKGGVA